jgi:hypothetical protein
MPIGLVEFWKKCPLDGATFIHPDDSKVLASRPGLTRRCDFDAFVKSPEFDSSDLHVSLRPMPYFGDLEKADIFILLLNPGLGYTDYWGERNVEPFRDRLEGSLYQSFHGVEFPFMWLDPQFCWHGGFVWWDKKLRNTILKLAEMHFDGSYFEAAKNLSNRLACLELIPYHSHSFGAHKLLTKLPSAIAMKEFVRNSLVPAALKSYKTLIATRQTREWDLPTNHGSLIIYEGGQTRGASLGPDTTGGAAILRRYQQAGWEPHS